MAKADELEKKIAEYSDEELLDEVEWNDDEFYGLIGELPRP